MNIFILDLDPKACARAHCDKHVVKMALETAQILCTAVKDNPYKAEAFEQSTGLILYKQTHDKHPCVLWAKHSPENFAWLCNLGKELCLEYSYRYNKSHASTVLIYEIAEYFVKLSTPLPETFALAMPDEYKPFSFVPSRHECVSSYRNYYRVEKKHLLTYTKRAHPSWLGVDNPLDV